MTEDKPISNRDKFLGILKLVQEAEENLRELDEQLEAAAKELIPANSAVLYKRRGDIADITYAGIVRDVGVQSNKKVALGVVANSKGSDEENVLLSCVVFPAGLEGL